MLFLLKGVLKSCTPFMIGSGTDIGSDSDVLRNGNDQIFIPGTTLAGVCRHFLEEYLKSDSAEMNKDEINKIFGGKNEKKEKSDSDEKDTLESEIIFYDAFECVNDKEKNLSSITSVRDSVRLNHKVSVDKSKFDYEIVEAGSCFTFRLEWLTDKEEESAKKILQTLIWGFQEGDIRIGSKTSRGFGEFELTDLKYLALDLEEQNDMTDYIELDSEWKSEIWNEWETIKNHEYSSPYETINIDLVLDSFLFLRNYAGLSKVDIEDEESKFVDAETMTDAKDNPIIPGTTWAGVFRHHCAKILKDVGYGDEEAREALLDRIFGYQNKLDENGELKKSEEDKKRKSKSNILFKETKIDKDNVVLLNRTRSAIDRFSGSALQTGALFTERIACTKDGDKTKVNLEMKISKKMVDFEFAKSLVNACIEDLKSGILAVGGNTAIGAGIFSNGSEEGCANEQ